MIQSKVVSDGNNVSLQIEGKNVPVCGYITYFEERNEYSAFEKAGYKIYSVTVSFAKQPINTGTGFTPYTGGIFDCKGKADFTELEKSIQRILDICPDAYIFPRVYITMPQWWVDENPTETVPIKDGKFREALYSDKFRKDAGELLEQFIAYIKASEFSEHIFGYQLAGGNTQEWFHFDLQGGLCENALPYFNTYIKSKGLPLAPLTELPPLQAIFEEEGGRAEYIRAYLRFANECVADTIDYLAEVAKKAVDYKQVIGAFYGYILEVDTPLWGTHCLSKLLESPNVDFFCAPNSYLDLRPLGEDWGDMIPVDSVRLHNKICLMECDIRTCLSDYPNNCRQGSDPEGHYNTDVWKGPSPEPLSVSAVRKCLAHQITHGNSMWWFDMWGGWYASDALMLEMEKALMIYTDISMNHPVHMKTEVAVFVDEALYARLWPYETYKRAQSQIRTALGRSGAPYDIYLISDFEKCFSRGNDYKTVLFPIPVDTEMLCDAISYCEENNISYMRATQEKCQFTAEELKEYFATAGVWCYCESEDVVYVGNGYVAIHAKTEGQKTIKFPKELVLEDVSNGIMYDRLEALNVQMQQYETRIFKIRQD